MLRALTGYLALVTAVAALTALAAFPVPVSAQQPTNADPPPGKLDIHSSTDPIEQYLVADCDGDGWDEVLTYGFPQPGFTDVLIRWYYDGSRFRQAEQWPMREGKITNCRVADLESDGIPDILVTCLGGMQAWVEVYAAGSPAPVRSSPRIQLVDRDGDGAWGGNFFVEACGDLDGDGVKDIFVSYGAGYDILPRGIAVLSGADFTELGSFPTAGPPERVEIHEGGGLEDMVILLSTESVSNGRRVGDFNDAAMYLIALNADLEVMWHVMATSTSARWGYEVADLDGDGEPEVVMSRRWERGSDALAYRLEARDIRTGEVEKFRPLITDVDAMLVADLDRDTAPEIVTALVDGTVHVLDTDLEIVYERAENPVLYLFFAGDIDQDGNMEIVGRGTGSRARIFDERLNLLASRDFGSHIRRMEFALVGAREPFLLVSVPANRDLRFMRLKNARRTAGGLISSGYGRFSQLGWKLLWLIPVLAFVAGLALALYILKKRANGDDRADGPSGVRATRAELVVALASFGHSGATRSNLERLAQYCEVPPDPDNDKYPEYQRQLSKIIEGYNEFTRVKLEQIAQICKRLADCKENSMVLFHHLKKLNDLVGEGGAAAPAAASVAYGPEESSAISAHARALLEEIRSVTRKVMDTYSIDVGAAVCRVLPVIKEQIARYDVNRVSLVIEDGGVARIDEDALKTCLETLMVNAAEAMEAGPEKSLSITISGGEGLVEIWVKDTGPGIVEADFEKVFERGFTTKGEGRGDGLYLAREIAQRYGGRVFVGSSSPGGGTLMVLHLKRVAE